MTGRCACGRFVNGWCHRCWQKRVNVLRRRIRIAADRLANIAPKPEWWT